MSIGDEILLKVCISVQEEDASCYDYYEKYEVEYFSTEEQYLEYVQKVEEIEEQFVIGATVVEVNL